MVNQRYPRMRNIETRRHRRADGSVLETFRVRWVDEDGERQAATFDDVEDAIAFRDELEERATRLRLGPPARARTTVADAKDRWWREHVVPRLAQRTCDNYDGAWRRHVEPRIGGMLLVDLTTGEIERLKDEMLANGLGASTVRACIALVGSILSFAARRDMVDFNPVIAVEKPAARGRRRRSMPPSIEVVENIRRVAADDLQSPLTAIWCSIGAYAGLRPGEIRGLLWAHIHEHTIYVANTPDPDGRPSGNTKTYCDRPAELLPVLAEDLWAWRAITPFAADSDPVIPTSAGTAMTDNDYKNFVRRKFSRAAAAAGWPCVPYDLRHFNASLLIKEGRLSLQEIAGHLGHTLVELSRTYAHEIREYRGRHVDVQSEIDRVRAHMPCDEPLRRLATELGADISRAPRHVEPGATDGHQGFAALAALSDLNAGGLLSSDELATKVRLLVAR